MNLLGEKIGFSCKRKGVRHAKDHFFGIVYRPAGVAGFVKRYR
jgi:hypothetical protein